MKRYVGIDMSKDKLDVELMDEQQHTRYRQVENTPSGWGKLDKWLRSAGAASCWVCLEVTGHYSVNPARIRGYANGQGRSKTDKLDAQIIADFCRTQECEAWSPPGQERRVLQGLVRHWAVLEADKGAVDNHLRKA